MRERQGLLFWLFEAKDIKHTLFLIRHMFHNYVIKDTKEEIIYYTYCKIFGHTEDYSSVEDIMYQEQDIHCKHCKTYIRSLSYEEHKKFVRIKKLKNVI